MSNFIAKIKGAFKKFRAIDLYKNKMILFLIPVIIVFIALICGTCYELTNTKFDKFANIGVDFQGGTRLTVDFISPGMNSGERGEFNEALIRKAVTDNGFTVSQIQTSGDSTFEVRYLNTRSVNGQLVDYSTDAMFYEMTQMNDEIIADISVAAKAKYGDTLTIDATGTAIGNSSAIRLLRTALISVSIALALMLIYVLIRYDIYSSLAAIIALLHDVIIMMAFNVIFYVEIGSSLIAGIITIVAYSINNTIVVFGRVRDNIKPFKSQGNKYDIGKVVNDSIWGTMTRTVYTTFTTLIVIVILASMGISSIQAFALPIIFGLIAGFYSSSFIAAPLWGTLKTAGENLKLKRQNKSFSKKAKQPV